MVSTCFLLTGISLLFLMSTTCQGLEHLEFFELLELFQQLKVRTGQVAVSTVWLSLVKDSFVTIGLSLRFNEKDELANVKALKYEDTRRRYPRLMCSR